MLWFSIDCQNWKKASLPTDEGILGLIYYQGKYVLYTAHPGTYSYMKEGLIFDSEKEDSYSSAAAWQSSSLDGRWKRCDEAPAVMKAWS